MENLQFFKWPLEVKLINSLSELIHKQVNVKMPIDLFMNTNVYVKIQMFTS